MRLSAVAELSLDRATGPDEWGKAVYWRLRRRWTPPPPPPPPSSALVTDDYGWCSERGARTVRRGPRKKTGKRRGEEKSGTGRGARARCRFDRNLRVEQRQTDRLLWLQPRGPGKRFLRGRRGAQWPWRRGTSRQAPWRSDGRCRTVVTVTVTPSVEARGQYRGSRPSAAGNTAKHAPRQRRLCAPWARPMGRTSTAATARRSLTRRARIYLGEPCWSKRQPWHGILLYSTVSTSAPLAAPPRGPCRRQRDIQIKPTNHAFLVGSLRIPA